MSITTGVGAPRAVFVDYPLGRTAGKPFDTADQADIVGHALDALVTMTEPGSVRRLTSRWSNDDAWKDRAQRSGWVVDGLQPSTANPEADDRSERSDQPQWQSDDDRIAWEFATR